MRILLAILSCHRFAERRDAQRETWLRKLKGAEYRFFLGSPTAPSEWPRAADEEVFLEVPDDYSCLCLKTKAVMNWARSQQFDYVCKLDDDTFVVPDRLLASGFETHKYSGFTEAGWEVTEPFRFVRGGSCYWLDKWCIDIIASRMLLRRHCEDVAVGQTLARHGIHPFHDDRYCHEEEQVNREAVLASSTFISLHKCDPQQMMATHRMLGSY